MEYFVKGTAHFFNLFADLLEYCENYFYFLIIIGFLFLVIINKKNLGKSFFQVAISYLKLLKFPNYIFALLLIIIWTYLTFTNNNQFMILSIIVCFINIIKNSIKIYDNNILKTNNNNLLHLEDFKSYIFANIFLIFFKITYWAEDYYFNIEVIKKYFIAMIIVLLLQFIYIIYCKLYSVYSETFSVGKVKKEYSRKLRIKNFISILFICNNKVNYFRLAKSYIQRNKMDYNDSKSLINFIFFSKSFMPNDISELNIIELNKKYLSLYYDTKLNIEENTNEKV